MRRAHWMSIALLACSGESKDDPPLSGEPPADTDTDTDTDADADADADADTDTDADTDADTDTDVVPEICDGIDNDGDGAIDEDFEDFDADGLADCIDDDCELQYTTFAVELLPMPCTTTYEVALSHTATSPRVFGSGLTAGRLVDHTGDGQVDALDSPTLIHPNELGLTYFDAATGTLDLTVSGRFHYRAGVVADVDGDGDSEAVAVTEVDPVTHEWSIQATDGTGAVVWASPPRVRGTPDNGYLWEGCDLTVADLDADGTNEVLCGGWVVDGATGADRFDIGENGFLAVGDLDLDGTAEVLVGGRVFDHTGALEWGYGLAGEPIYPALVQLDADPEAEVLFAIPFGVAAFEHDGTPIGSLWEGGDEYPHHPCVADVDHDQLSEVAVPFMQSLVMFDTDGAVLWDHPTPYNAMSCTVFDFDVDGAPEIVVAHSQGFEILDAATGAVRYTDGSISPFATGNGFAPMVIDVDGDASTEVLVPMLSQMGGGGTLEVFENPARAWPGSGPSWGVLDFAEGRVSDDGLVNLPPFWLEAGSQVRVPTTERPPILDLGGIELGVELLDACAASCTDGPQKFAVQVSNHGGLTAPAGIPISLLARVPDEVVIGSAVLSEIPSGGFEIVTFRVEDPADTGGNSLFVRIESPYPSCTAADLQSGFPEDQCL